MPLQIPTSSSGIRKREFYSENPEIEALNEFGLFTLSFLRGRMISTADGYRHAHFDPKEVSFGANNLLIKYAYELESLLVDPTINLENYSFDKSSIIDKIGDILSLCTSILSKEPDSFDLEPENVQPNHYQATYRMSQKQIHELNNQFRELQNGK